MKRILWITCFWIGMSCGSGLAQLTPTLHPEINPSSRNSRELFDESMRLFDASYDPQAHLVLRPHDGGTHVRGHYMVRESSWYALGLMMRARAKNRPADVDQAAQILGTVLDQQYLDPNMKCYGTFKRSPEESGPGDHDIAFTSYDPNWRQFIGTTLEMILLEFPGRLPSELETRMYRAIDTAVSGEIHDGRLVPSYSNIALMYGALWDFAAVHDNNADWLSRSQAWTEAVYSLFQRYGTFNEYNAPTYYGVDLYGLALWREYGSTLRMRRLGRTMEAALWNDLANFYQPELRNIAGPYDRSYGMDMSNYVTVTGVWMRTALDAAHAPLPAKPTLTTSQVADMWFAPHITLLGTHIPNSALMKFRRFAGPHMVHRRIDSSRVATSWVGDRAMWGGEFTGMTKDSGGKTQFHPVTVQWSMPDRAIGWIKITRSPNIDAVADPEGVTITTHGDVSFRIFTGKSQSKVSKTTWALPGFLAEIQTDAQSFSTSQPSDCSNCEDVLYTGTRSIHMEFHPDRPHASDRSATD